MAYFTYQFFRIAEAKAMWFDHLALISFFPALLAEVLFYVLSLIWIYAGVKSLFEVVS